MRIKAVFVAGLFILVSLIAAQAQAPLRVFIRGGTKDHGPGQHDHPRFLEDWKKLLNDRGLPTDGAMNFPSAAQLEKTDVIVIYAADGMKITGQDRTNCEKFLQRGGGLVVIHDGVVAGDEVEWSKKVQGGAWVWVNNRTKWFEGQLGIYVVDPHHPITEGLSNFDWNDEIYYQLDMAPDVHVLATSFQTPFIVAPQLWTYEKTWDGGTAPYRAFVSIPGHEYVNFSTPHYRAILLRGIAWAGKRASVDEFCKPEELASLRYPVGGPTAPDKAAAKIQVHPDFDLKLVASEPLVEKVISMDWDTKGRLWVVETPEYPNGRTINRKDNPIYPLRQVEPDKYIGTRENRPARDRVSILEDTTGSGVMNKKTVFYEGLELATSLVFYKDGVIVNQAPDILWIRDTDGDGKADKVEKLYTGFGTNDTHAVISNLRWGMDGWVYSSVGYSAGNPTSPDGSKSFGRITAGIFRFKPDGSAVQQVASGSCNTWGLDFTWDNEIIYTTATCGEPICHVVMPEWVVARGTPGVRATIPIIEQNRVYPAITKDQRTVPYKQIDWVDQFTAAAGSCMYVGGAWPEKWNNAHFVSEATVNLTHQEFLDPKGVTYQGRKEDGRKDKEFLNATDLWFRPIHQRVGPDGALYVVDFYNQAAVHNDTRGPDHGANNAAVRPDRDHHFARIWRVQHKEAKTLPPYNFAGTELVQMLAHPNGWARMTAHRLLSENPAGATPATVTALTKMATAPSSEVARLHSLFVLANLKQLPEPMLLAAMQDPSPAVRKNALKIVAESDAAAGGSQRTAAIRGDLNDADGRVQMNALIALQSLTLDDATIAAVVQAWPSLQDKYLESAALGVASANPLQFVAAIFKSPTPAPLAPFAAAIAKQVGGKQDAKLAAQLVILAGSQSAVLDGLKQILIESLTASLQPRTVPDWSPELQSALSAMLKSSTVGLNSGVLPLVARWDQSARMTAEVKGQISQMLTGLEDTTRPEAERAQLALNLLGARRYDDNAIPSIAKILQSNTNASLSQRLIEVLGTVPDVAAANALIIAFPRLSPEAQTLALSQIFKRNEWSLALLDAIQQKKVSLASFGAVNLHRLRTHPSREVSLRANQVIDELRGPEQKEKDKLIAQFTPAVQQPGNVENGHKVFLANCANCHTFGTEGRDLAPNLTGMGAHGPADLLVHILDPNRVVEPNFFSWSIETKDEQVLDGIIVRENRTTIALRNASGDFEIRADNIKSRRNTGLSLMPNGFEALGAEGLRDLLAFIGSTETKYRILDLSTASTASSLRGMYNTMEATNEALRFIKFGIVRAGDIPFEILSPAKSISGNNVIVLKGGARGSYSRTLPQKVELKVGVPVTTFHFLGGVAGWGYPSVNDDKLAVVKATVYFQNGQTEEFTVTNGVEIADYNGRADVPGSKPLDGVVRSGQVRWFSKSLKNPGPVEKITLESFNNGVAPTFAAITAEIVH